MLKSLILGFVLGIIGMVAAVYYVPVVDQYRETSVISVEPNGGNSESFYINVPMDRILVGVPDRANPVPPGLNWPGEAFLDDVRVELFKVRNSRNAVIGVASRVAAQSDSIGDSIEWVLHFPARGSLFVSMPARSRDGVSRIGDLRAGTREFQAMHGTVSERWVANVDDETEDAPEGRIELVAALVGEFSDDVTQSALAEGVL